MSYEPTVWKSGDVVTSAKLNKLEQGVAGGGSGGGKFVINATLTEDAQAESGYAVEANHTFAEIAEALENGMVCELWAKYSDETAYKIFQMLDFSNGDTNEITFNRIVAYEKVYLEFIMYDSNNGWEYIKGSVTGDS